MITGNERMLILEVHDSWSEPLLQGLLHCYYYDYEIGLIIRHSISQASLHLTSVSYLVRYKNSYFNKFIGIKNSFTTRYLLPITTHYLTFTSNHSVN
jgi:hypothetical protein